MFIICFYLFFQRAGGRESGVQAPASVSAPPRQCQTVPVSTSPFLFSGTGHTSGRTERTPTPCFLKAGDMRVFRYGIQQSVSDVQALV